MKKKFSRILSCALVTAILFTSYSTTAFADYIGSGGGSGNTNGAGNWNENKSGYRFTIVDPATGGRVSNSVDILFSKAPTTQFGYYTCKSESFQSYKISPTVVYVNDMMKTHIVRDKDGAVRDGFDPSKVMPEPVYYKQGSNKAFGNGEALKKWLLDGAKSINYGSIANGNSGSSNSKNDSGNTKGNASDRNKGSSASDLPSYKPYALALSSALRTSQKNAAVNYLAATNKLEEASQLSREFNRDVAPYLGEGKLGYTSDNKAYDIIKQLSGGKWSNALKIYILCNALGSYTGTPREWVYGPQQPPKFKGLSVTGALDNSVQNIKYLAKPDSFTQIAYEPIPLATPSKKGANEEGKNAYIRSILNYKKNGVQVFQFLSTVPQKVKDEKSVVEKITVGGYKVEIEPIFFYTPQNSSGAYFKYKGTTPTVYGTVTNLASFYVWALNTLGWSDGPKHNGGWYYNIQRVGAWGLYLDKDPGVKDLYAANARKYGLALSDLELANTSIGYGMHVYSASNDGQEIITPEGTTPGQGGSSSGDSDLTLRESEISKVVQTSNSEIPGWGKKIITFGFGSFPSSESRQVKNPDGTKHTEHKDYSLVDKSYTFKLNIANLSSLNKSIVAAANGFAPVLNNNVKNGSRSSLGSFSVPMSDYNVVMALWRGKDIPTISSYNSSHSTLDGLLGRFGKTPQGSRGSSYSDNLSLVIGQDNSGDYTTSAKAFTTKTDTAKGGTATYNGNVNVRTYTGLSRPTGNQTNTGLQSYSPLIRSVGSSATSGGGYSVKNPSILNFFPFISMTYETPTKASKTEANLLSTWKRSVQNSDYAEAGYFRPNDSNLSLNSYQWSMSYKAVNGSDGWQGRNQVLPGGSLYKLSTPSENASTVSAITWQVYLTPAQRNALANGVSSKDYTLASAQSAHNSYADGVKNTLDKLRIVQYVNQNPKGSPFSGTKITGPNQSLSSLGLPNKTSSESKYWLTGDTGNSAGDGDLDILSSETSKTYFSVTSDSHGNIYVKQSNDSNMNNAQTIATLAKNQDASYLIGLAKDLDDRTKVVTNMVTALERNTGNDNSAPWATSDGKWYNEGTLGVCIVRQETGFKVGLGNPGIRGRVLDPRLEPSHSGTASLFTKAFSSAFRCNSKSDIHSDKPDNYVGTFKGQDIVLPDLQDMYKSKVFYIPNVSESDLDH